MIAIRDQQLELQGDEIVVGIACSRPGVEDDEQRVGLAEVAEQLRACPRDVDHAQNGGRDLLRLLNVRDGPEALVRNRRHADVLLARHGCPRPGQSLEERRLAGVRQADNADRESQSRGLG